MSQLSIAFVNREELPKQTHEVTLDQVRASDIFLDTLEKDMIILVDNVMFCVLFDRYGPDLSHYAPLDSLCDFLRRRLKLRQV